MIILRVAVFLVLSAVLVIRCIDPAMAVASVENDTSGAKSKVSVETPLAESKANHVQSFRSARLSIQQAIAIAEKASRTGSTLSVTFDDLKNIPVYRVTTFSGDRIYEVIIDANKGSVRRQNQTSQIADLEIDDRKVLRCLSKTGAKFRDAVFLAEATAKGRAIGGGVTLNDGILSFLVLVLSGDDFKQVSLDPPLRGANGRC